MSAKRGSNSGSSPPQKKLDSSTPGCPDPLKCSETDTDSLDLPDVPYTPLLHNSQSEQPFIDTMLFTSQSSLGSLPASAPLYGSDFDPVSLSSFPSQPGSYASASAVPLHQEQAVLSSQQEELSHFPLSPIVSNLDLSFNSDSIASFSSNTDSLASFSSITDSVQDQADLRDPTEETLSSTVKSISIEGLGVTQTSKLILGDDLKDEIIKMVTLLCPHSG